MAHLSEAQRYTISQLKKQNYSLRQIGEIIGRDKSVISRELSRNCDRRSGEYRYDLAQRKYEKRLHSKPKFRRFTDEIRHSVIEKIEDDFSPEQIVGRNHKGAIFTAVDRVTRLVWIELLEGKEFAEHKAIAEGLNIDFYFAHPYHSWERGANENTNGLTRQYIPKGTSFENLTKETIRQIQNRLNDRPRKIIGYLTPIEYYNRIFAPENNKLKVAFVT